MTPNSEAPARNARTSPAVPVLLCLVSLCCVLACSPPKSQVLRLERRGGPIIHTGLYPGYIRILSAEEPLARRAEAWCRDVECNEKVLRRLVRERFDTDKSPLEFRHMFTALDSARNVVLVRYFAFHPNPSVIAGWEVFLVYELPRGMLTEAHVAEVPLE